MNPGSSSARRLAAALVLLLHLALLAWWLRGDWHEARSAAEVPRVSVRLIARAPPAAAVPAPVRHDRSPESKPAPRLTRPARPQPDAPSPAAAAQAITMAAPEAAASQPAGEALPSLMDGEATRRAIRAAAREPGIAAVAGRQGPALQTPEERLGSEVQRSAKGDCLKGEYLGGGMGLLSLPFLAAAALRDQCRR